MTRTPPLSEDQLLKLYFVRETVPELARRNNVRPSWLLDQFEKLREEGKLPPGSRTNTVMLAIRKSDEGMSEGLPSVGFADALLDRLFAIHNVPPGEKGYKP